MPKMEFPGPWALSTNSCTKAADCRWFEEQRFVRGVCAELSAASLSQFTETSSNFSSRTGARMCTCDPRLSLDGAMCTVESPETYIYRYMRVGVIAVQIYIFWVGFATLRQAQKRRSFTINPMWVSLILSLVGCATELVWNVSFAVSSIGKLNFIAQVVAQVGGKLFFLVSTCVTSAGILLLSIVWIVVLQARKSGLVMHGRLSRPTYLIAFSTSLLLVLVVAVLNSVKTFKVSSFSGIPFVCIIASMYAFVFYRICQVKKKLAHLEKNLSFSPARELTDSSDKVRNNNNNNNNNRSAVSPSRRFNGAAADGIIKALAQEGATRRAADEDEEDDDVEAASADPYASKKRSVRYLFTSLSEALLPFMRMPSGASIGRSSGTPSRGSSSLGPSSARSSGSSTNIPNQRPSAMVSAADLEALRARSDAGQLRACGSNSTNCTRVRVKRASILIQSLDHMAVASMRMVVSLLFVAIGAIGVALTVENFEMRGLAPLFSLIFSASLVMIHFTIIYFVRSAHFSAVKYRRWRKWLRNNPDPFTDETKPSQAGDDDDEYVDNDLDNGDDDDDEEEDEEDDNDDDDDLDDDYGQGDDDGSLRHDQQLRDSAKRESRV